MDRSRYLFTIGALIGIFVASLFAISSALASDAAADRALTRIELRKQAAEIQKGAVTYSGLIRCETNKMSNECDIYMLESQSQQSYKLMGSAYLTKLLDSGIRQMSVVGHLSQPTVLEVKKIILE